MEKFVGRQKELLELEREAEIAEAADLIQVLKSVITVSFIFGCPSVCPSMILVSFKYIKCHVQKMTKIFTNCNARLF